jgi:hypothetical protein
MFPLGTHRARPVDAMLGMTGTKKEQIGVMFEHVETKERITWYGYFTDGTFERTIESLRYLGWGGDNLADFHRGLPTGVDNEVDIVVEDETDERDGTVRRKVRWINSGGGVAIKDVLDDDQVRSFSARMRDRVAALQAIKGAPPKTAPSSRPAASRPAQAQGAAVAAGVSRGPARTMDPNIDDEDIPF